MRDRAPHTDTAPAHEQADEREVWFPAGSVIGGMSIEAAGGATRRSGQHLVKLMTDAGTLISPPDQAVWVRRRAADPAGPYGEPEWVPAARVRLGDSLCRPRPSGPDFWLAVTAISHHTSDRPLYRFTTAEESVLAHGFVTRADWRRR